MPRFLTLLLLSFLCMASAAIAEDSELASVFQQYSVDGTLVIRQLNSGIQTVHNEARANQRYSPASTFKIPNTLIGLSQGVVDTNSTLFKWDGQVRWLDAWNKNHTLQSAYASSCVWCYQQIARQLNHASYQNELSNIEYGNKTLGRNIEQFWLDGSLTISAIEQVEFLTRLVNNQLPYPSTLHISTKNIMSQPSDGDYKLYAKTGWAAQNINVGWYVGFVESRNEVLVFAMNMHLSDIKRADLRKQVVIQALKKMGLI